MANNRGNAQNPADALGLNEYAAQRLALHRPDQSTIAQPGGFYGGAGGNTVDRSAIPPTLNRLSKDETQAKPLGQSSSSGF